VKRVLLLVAVVAALLMVPGGTALACSCVGLTPGPAVTEVFTGAAAATGDGVPPRAAPQTQDPTPPEGPVRRLPGERNPAAGDTAWLVPLVGGSVLALLLGAALVLVLVRGRRR
jgi:hypothetical protein